MDLLSHALAGAGAAAATRPGRDMRIAALAGAVAALLVDIDYFIGSDADPLLQLEFHRHFTHSLVFIPVGALLASCLLYPLIGRRLGPKGLYLATLAGYATHWVLDICTSYGLHLLWPFSEQRIALDLISVVDPVFTVLFGLPVALALIQRRRAPLVAALGAALLYLGFSSWQQTRAASLAESLAHDRGHTPEALLLRPSFGNTVLWRSVYRAEGEWHIDAIRPGLVADPQIYPGGTLPVFDRESALPQLPEGSRIDADIQRLDALSDGYLVWLPEAGRLGDVRFSTLPDGRRPMWGLEFDPAQPESPPIWYIDRSLTPAMRTRFTQQLRGHHDP